MRWAQPPKSHNYSTEYYSRWLWWRMYRAVFCTPCFFFITYVQRYSHVRSQRALPKPASTHEHKLISTIFGIKFIHNGSTFLRPILQFEFAQCYTLCDNVTFHISHPINCLVLDAGIPGCTSSWVFSHIIDQLILICDSNIAQTLHRIRLRYYWPHMFCYIKKIPARDAC